MDIEMETESCQNCIKRAVHSWGLDVPSVTLNPRLAPTNLFEILPFVVAILFSAWLGWLVGVHAKPEVEARIRARYPRRFNTIPVSTRGLSWTRSQGSQMKKWFLGYLAADAHACIDRLSMLPGWEFSWYHSTASPITLTRPKRQ